MTQTQYAKINDSNIALWYNSDTVYHTFDFHAHEQYEIYLFQRGSVQYYLEDKAYALVPGDLLVIPPSVMHRAVIVEENALYHRFVLMLSEEYCRSLLKGVDGTFTGKNAQPQHIALDDEQYKEIQRKVNALMVLENDAAGRLARDSLCTLLLLQIQALTALPAEETPRRQAQEIVRYLNGHFTEEISLEEVARRFFISKTHLMRIFKAYTNTTVHNYVTAKRILLAKALLKEGMPVAEVSEACGFSSYASFYQAFVRYVQVNPTDYRKTQC